MKKQSITPELNEIIKEHSIYTKGGYSANENSNKVIATKGWDYIYNTVEKDLHYSSVIGTRANELVSRGYKIYPAYTQNNGVYTVSARDRIIADFVQSVLDSMSSSFEQDIVAMMSHISRGFSISEINWDPITKGRNQGKIGIKDIRFKMQHIFSFKVDPYGRYEIKNPIDRDTIIPKQKVIHLISGMNDEDPYGDPMAAKCAFWIWMKLNGIKYWAIHQERFGSPLTALFMPPNSEKDPEKIKIADEILAACETDTGVRLPEGLNLKFIEAMRSGDAGYQPFYEVMNREVSKGVLGSTLTNDVGSAGLGNHALGQEHAKTTSAYFNFDMICIQAAINNQIIRRIVDYNFPDVEKYPKIVWNNFNQSMFIAIAQALPNIAQTNAKIPLRIVNELLNIPFPEANEEVLEILNKNAESLPQIKGIDNRSKHEAGLCPAHFSAESEAIKENENIISTYTKNVAIKWDNFAKVIAKKKKVSAKDIYTFEVNELADDYHHILILGHLRGKDSAAEETAKKSFSSSSIPVHFSEYRPFDKVIKDYIDKGVISKDEYKKLDAWARRKAFTISEIDSEEVIRQIKDKLLEVLKGNSEINELYNQIIEVMSSAGLTPLQPSHVEVVMRNNLNTQFTEGRFRIFADMDPVEFPCLQIIAILDDVVRDNHAKLHHYTRTLDDPVWSWLRPPFDHNCRCSVRAVHKSESYQIADWVPNRSEYRFLK